MKFKIENVIVDTIRQGPVDYGYFYVRFRYRGYPGLSVGKNIHPGDNAHSIQKEMLEELKDMFESEG